MYSFSYLEPVCCSMTSSNCCFLTCIQVSQEAGQVVWYSRLFQNFPQFIVIHTAKGFGIVNKAEIDVFLEVSCFFGDPMDVGNLISGSSAFSKTSLNISKFTVHMLLKPGLDNVKHYFTSVWDECNCAAFWAFFSIAFLWDWNENWPFPVLWPLWSFPYLLTPQSVPLISAVPAADTCSSWLLDDGRPNFVLSSLRAYCRGGLNLWAWWMLQHPLFTRMAGCMLSSQEWLW